MNDIGSKSGAEMIEFPCPECSTRLKVGASLAGQPAKCPSCASVAVVPGSENQQPAEAANVVGAPVNLSSGPTDPSSPNAQSGLDETIVPEIAPVVVPGSAESDGTSSGPEIGDDTPVRQLYRKITTEVAKVFVGQDELLSLIHI